MPEAFVVRDIQRQKLLEQLMKRVFDYESEVSEVGTPSYLFRLAGTIVNYLFLRVEKEESLTAAKSCIASQPSREQEFWEKIFIEFTRFSRSPAERDALLAEFLERILGSALQRFKSERLREEIHEPAKIYGPGVTNMTDEVEYDFSKIDSD